MFKLDGKPTDISEDDIKRRNLVVKLLKDWNLVTVLDLTCLDNIASLSSVKVLSFKAKDIWVLVLKYTIGSKTNY